jgi:hypothetical protein
MTMTQRSSKNTFFGWLGRQVGHVKTAVKTDATKPEPKVIYRNDKVEEKSVPNQPGVKLRRTTIDEVIVDPNQKQLKK